jgi:hypothetical protein
MAENYSHLFIPTSPLFRPSTADLARFFEGVVKTGIVGQVDEFHFQRVRSVEPEVRIGRNPFSGESVVLRMPTFQVEYGEVILDPTEIEARARSATDYNVSVFGTGDSRNSPLTVGTIERSGWTPFARPFRVDIECRIRSTTVSMSSIYGEEADKLKIKRFGEPCDTENRTGYFADPDKMTVAEVQGAGCASFWIELGFGKWLCPRVDSSQVALADPDFTRFAAETFGVDFLQGFIMG